MWCENACCARYKVPNAPIYAKCRSNAFGMNDKTTRSPSDLAVSACSIPIRKRGQNKCALTVIVDALCLQSLAVFILILFCLFLAN